MAAPAGPRRPSLPYHLRPTAHSLRGIEQRRSLEGLALVALEALAALGVEKKEKSQRRGSRKGAAERYRALT